MRIVRVKLKPEVSEYLRTLCVRFAINDLPFLEDLYALALTKGGGLPDNTRLDTLVDAYAKLNGMQKLTVRVILNKRRQVLKDIAANPLFQVATKRRKLHPREVTEQLLELYFDLYRRVRQSQCMTCQFLGSCSFGQTYGKLTTSIHAVVDPDYAQKVHPQCPERPTMDMYAQLAAAQAQITNLAQNPAQLETAKQDPAAQSLANSLPAAITAGEQSQAAAPVDSEDDPDSLPKSIEDAWENEDDACGVENSGACSPGSETTCYSTTFLAPSINIDMTMVNKIKMHNFLLFELARKLTTKLMRAHKGKFKPSSEVTKDQKTKNIKSVGDVARILPREHAQDDAVFDRKLQNRQLHMRQSQKPDDKKHLLYILVDTSDSMNSCVATGKTFWQVISRALLSASFSLALIDLIESEEGIVYMRGFDGSQSSLHHAKDKDEFAVVRRFISRCRYNGGSTNIMGALLRAIEDIKTAQNELRDAEILLITDCGDTITGADVIRIKQALGKTVLNVMDVASTSSGSELAAGLALREMADHYFKVNGGAGTLDQLVSLVGGSKAPIKK